MGSTFVMAMTQARAREAMEASAKRKRVHDVLDPMECDRTELDVKRVRRAVKDMPTTVSSVDLIQEKLEHERRLAAIEEMMKQQEKFDRERQKEFERKGLIPRTTSAMKLPTVRKQPTATTTTTRRTTIVKKKTKKKASKKPTRRVKPVPMDTGGTGTKPRRKSHFSFPPIETFKDWEDNLVHGGPAMELYIMQLPKPKDTRATTRMFNAVMLKFPRIVQLGAHGDPMGSTIFKLLAVIMRKFKEFGTLKKLPDKIPLMEIVGYDQLQHFIPIETTLHREYNICITETRQKEIHDQRKAALVMLGAVEDEAEATLNAVRQAQIEQELNKYFNNNEDFNTGTMGLSALEIVPRMPPGATELPPLDPETFAPRVPPAPPLELPVQQPSALRPVGLPPLVTLASTSARLAAPTPA